MANKTMHDLFHDVLKDIYFAEKKILVALPKMAKAAESAELEGAFLLHREQTQEHVSRLEKVFELIDKKPQGKTCPAINGILEEGTEMMDENEGSATLDAALIAAAQAVEHYEISRYGTLKSWAELLGISEAVELFEQTLEEEKQTDEDLTGLAEQVANPEARAAAAE
jgi:ferritin-like metal-binding protein YciE